MLLQLPLTPLLFLWGCVSRGTQDVTAAERALAGVTNECATFHQLPPDMIAASSALDAARDELRALKEELHAALERGASVA